MAIAWLLKFFYKCGLVGGLLPAPLVSKGQDYHFHTRHGYLIYTLMVNGFILLLLPLTFPRFIYTDSYMSDNTLLQWNFTITSITRILCILVCGGLVWLKRKKLLALGEDLLRHCQLCSQLDYKSQNSIPYEQLRARIRGLLFQKFCVVNLNIFAPAALLLRVESDHMISYLVMVFVHMLQFTYTVIATMALYVTLLLLYWQMQRINLGLQDVFDNFHHKSNRTSLRSLNQLYQLYAQSVKLLQRVLQISDVCTACLLLKMFVTNVYLIYNGVQFGNCSIETGWVTKILGDSVLLTHYWNGILVMNLFDSLTRRTGIEMSLILRQFTDLEISNRDFELQLEVFSDHVRCHPTAYKVCGLFTFNKTTSLMYFFNVLVEVLVLVQFDLKNKVNKQ